MNGWCFNIIDTWDQVWDSENVARWYSVLQQSSTAHVFFHPSIARAWVDTFLPLRRMQPVFIWATSNEGNEGFLPLVLWARNWKNACLHILVPIGYSDFDYHSPVFRQPVEDKNRFWRQFLSFVADNVRYDTAYIDGIQSEWVGDDSCWIRNELCPSLIFEAVSTDSDVMSMLNTKLRGDLRRQMRRLSEKGILRLHVYEGSDEAREPFNAFLQEHACKWPKAYKAPQFHWNLLVKGFSEGLVHFSSLELSGKPVAWHLGFAFRGRFYYYMPVSNHDLSAYSPGKILLYLLVEWAANHGYTTFDFLKGDESYKKTWSNRQDHVFSVMLQSGRASSRLKRLLLSLRP